MTKNTLLILSVVGVAALFFLRDRNGRPLIHELISSQQEEKAESVRGDTTLQRFTGFIDSSVSSLATSSAQASIPIHDFLAQIGKKAGLESFALADETGATFKLTPFGVVGMSSP